MLADVTARHNDIIKLEKSLKDLHDLFLEMALLVESQVSQIKLKFNEILYFLTIDIYLFPILTQGEVVDRIETQVTSTRDYTEKAREQLKQAEVLQTKARKVHRWRFTN